MQKQNGVIQDNARHRTVSTRQTQTHTTVLKLLHKENGMENAENYVYSSTSRYRLQCLASASSPGFGLLWCNNNTMVIKGLLTLKLYVLDDKNVSVYIEDLLAAVGFCQLFDMGTILLGDTKNIKTIEKRQNFTNPKSWWIRPNESLFCYC